MIWTSIRSDGPNRCTNCDWDGTSPHDFIACENREWGRIWMGHVAGAIDPMSLRPAE